MIGLIGKKIGMTRIFDKYGEDVPVTVIQVGPCSVLQLKDKNKDGYTAVQLGFDPQKEARVTKAELGHVKKAGKSPVKYIREIRTDNVEGLEVGKDLHVNNFAVGDVVDVIATSKGRGFQGVVKRHKHRGGEKAHGTKMGREPGSIGASAFPSRVIKGLKLPGHMGAEQVTTQNLRVVKIDLNENLMAVHGAVPGPMNGYVIVREAVKRRRPRKWRLFEEGIEELKLPERVVQSAVKKDKKTAAASAAPAKKKK